MPVSFLSSIFHKKVLVLTHKGADVDSISSAATFYFSFRKNSRITIGIPEHLNLNAKAFARNMKIPYKLNPVGISDYDVLIIVDLNSYDMLGRLEKEVRNFKGPTLIIDHHTKSDDKITSERLSIVDKSATSTTELIYELFKRANIIIPSDAATCIAAGIVTDSAGFLNADSKTFRIMGDVLPKSKITYPKLLSLFSIKTDISEKIAMLKAARRCKIYRSSDYIIASTDVGAFEASAATVLVKLGADIAFAGDDEKGIIRVSARANNNFVIASGFDLARDVFSKLESEFNGSGGGHAAAAGFNGKGKGIEKILKRCVLLSHDFLKKQKPRSTLKLYS